MSGVINSNKRATSFSITLCIKSSIQDFKAQVDYPKCEIFKCLKGLGRQKLNLKSLKAFQKFQLLRLFNVAILLALTSDTTEKQHVKKSGQEYQKQFLLLRQMDQKCEYACSLFVGGCTR